MAAKALLRNRKAMTDVIFRTSQSTAITGSHHGNTISNYREHSTKHAKYTKNVPGSKMSLSTFTSRASSAQPAATKVSTVEHVHMNGKQQWTQVLDQQLSPQLEKIFLLGSNIMVTTHETDNAKVVYHNQGHDSILPSSLANIRCAARFPDGGFVLCSRSELTFFNAQGLYINSSRLAIGHPYAMTVDKNGKIYVSMLGLKAISIFNQDGFFNKIIHMESSPLNLAISKNRLVIAFVDGTVELIDPENPNVRSSLKSPSSSPYQNWQPTRVCCDNNGDMYVSDWRQGIVYKYSADGDYLTRVCEDLNDPQDIAVSENGEEVQVFESGLSGSILSSTQEPCLKTFKLMI